MASFDGSNDREVVRYPLRRIEPMVRRYIKVLRIDLGRLRKHNVNIQRFQELCDSAQQNKEQVNANTTVQQVNTTLRQLECTRTQILPEDVAPFDRQVGRVRIMLNFFAGVYRGVLSHHILHITSLGQGNLRRSSVSTRGISEFRE